MQHFKLEEQKGIQIVRIDRGTGNAINQDFLEELTSIFNEAQENAATKGILLIGKPHFFSVGLDLMELYEYDESKYEEFWMSFMQMLHAIYKFDKPFVCGITGHAPAGGCVISNCADYRVMAKGNYKIGLNEIPVGIIVPPSVYEMYAFWMGKKNASQALLEGKLFSPEEAHEKGLVDELTDLADVEAAALKKLKHYTALHAGAWSATKRNIRAEILPLYEPKKDEHFIRAQKQWWRPEVRAALKAYIDSIKKKA